MFRKSYRLDREKLLYRQVRLTFRQSLARFLIIFIVTITIAAAYGLGFKTYVGSPKESVLQEQLLEIQNKYSSLEQKFNSLDNDLMDIALAENNIYRPVLGMDTLAESLRKSGYGGSKRYEELEGYENSDLMIATMFKLDEIKRKAYIQSMSFEEIIPASNEWKIRMDHIPSIRPVEVGIRLGEGIRFRDDHPVLHISRWHYGQDFRSPSGTEVYSTGAGIVRRAAWTPYGFGNRVEIDHGYGYTTIYAHLSAFNVEAGQRIQRGDLIGLSGSTGVSSGPHMHYEVHLYGKVKDPNYFFGDDLNVAEYKDMILALQSDTSR